MKKSKYLALFAVAFVVGITGCKVEAEKHEHTFSKEWTTDEIAHWHAATCEHKTETSSMATHTFDVWKITREATETHEGEKERTCSVCKYVEKEIIAKLEHVHTFGSLTVIKEATELEDGYGERTCSTCEYVEQVPIYAYNHTHTFSKEWLSDETDHWHIAICGHTEVSEKKTHKWNEEIIKAATCTEDGEKKLVCSVCARTKTVVIPATGHSFATEWLSDATYHWHVATCEHSTEIGGKTEHTFGEWKDVQTSTDSSQQERYRICDVCSYEDKRAVSNIIDNLVKVDGITITGDETWTPESEIFIKGRKLTIPSLYVSDHEITMREYKKVIENFNLYTFSVSDADGNEYKKDNDKFWDAPMDVSWFNAIVFCNKLSEKELLNSCYTINGSENPDDWGAVPTSSESDNFALWNNCICDFTKNGYRLPTEVEWEYLARGGQKFEYSGSDKLDDVGWYKTNSIIDGSPSLKIVRLKNKNGYGLYDMSGNVSEWCWDFYTRYIYKELPFEGPSSTKNNDEYRPWARVCRGGDYYDSIKGRFSVYYRIYNSEYVGGRIGIRVVRTVTE
ncbi:SUMF1/EgtB/PvdO family nonheme iron enzyme [uncultured Treponema sp.]|uniref:formylglycine-generating enzyme family protein n=1 Tax=uncultured Treponema sp. TaxID=162155 RepID=UPI00260B49AC|nr:SUMF1/EgtB/PvdO family nonheme iron enzyme [uncultured Treponema sp.]